MAERDGPSAGLTLVDDLAERLDGYHLFHATRGDLLERLGRLDDAGAAYAAARKRTDNGAEQALLDEAVVRVTAGR
jgi:RNA polymerase sigma-70 factor (ECF subfamily)